MSNSQEKVTFKNVALLGAGAVGAYFIYGFNDLEDISFCVVAEGERAERLKNEGITINGEVYRPAVKTPAEAHGADFLIVATKYQGLEGSLDAIQEICDDHTTVVSMLNGIDSEEIIGNRIGMDHMVYSVTRISSEDGVHFVPETTIGMSFGEKGTTEISPRVQAIADLMAAANLKYFVGVDIILDQWSKYSMNIIYNLPQAVLNVGFGAYYDSEFVAKIRDIMYEEVCAIAAAEGVTLGEKGDWRSACVQAARFSTLQDLDAKRTTEIDMFLGVLLKLAEKHSIKIPFCEYTYYAIKALEEKNEGKFEY